MRSGTMTVRLMPRFQILYLRADKCEAFRGRAPGKPPYVLRRSHYEDGPQLAADSAYALWQALRDRDQPQGPDVVRPVDVGDALDSEEGLLLCNYWGFEPAEWREVPDSKDVSGGSGKAAEAGAASSRSNA